jgi:hypothetical protein
MTVGRPHVDAAILGVVRVVVAIAGPDNPSLRRRREQRFRRLELVVELLVELFDELVAHGDEGGRGVRREREKQREGVPAGQAHTNGRR